GLLRRADCLAHGMVGGEHAQAVAFDPECAVEAGAEVLERDRLSQLHDLLVAEPRANIGENFVRYIRGRARHPLGVPKHRLLAGVEVRTALKVSEGLELIVGYSGVSAHGRVDIDSERT